MNRLPEKALLGDMTILAKKKGKAKYAANPMVAVYRIGARPGRAAWALRLGALFYCNETYLQLIAIFVTIFLFLI
jgi:hypothetical protein